MEPQPQPAGIAGPSSNSAGIAGPSSNPAICPFLRAVDDDDVLTAATETPHPANRCAAMSEVVPQSLRQQDLVCLTSGHVNCPRFLRGVPLAGAPVVPGARARPSISWPILGFILVLVSALIGSVAFVVSRGGIDMAAVALPTRSAAASSSAQAVASVAPSVALATLAPATAAPLTSAPTTPPTPTPVPTPTPTPTAKPTQKPTPKPTARPSPKPTARPTARPTVKPVSSRYAVLDRCSSGAKNCWVYTIRSGDNLYSIANYFGIPLATIYDRNPWTRTESLRAGRELILPAPRR
ncbi:MAG: LysM domain-containing protein [Candidatus Limnocylindrales bacterium]